MKKSLKTLLIASALAACGTLSACAPEPKAFRFEAEQAILEDAEGQADNNIRVEAAGEAASNEYSVGYFTTTGQKITWTINSDRDAKGSELLLRLSAAKLNFQTYPFAIEDTDLGENYTLTNNGKAIEIGSDVIVSPDNPTAEEGQWLPDFYQFKDFKFKVDLVKGENKIVLEKGEGADGVNVDYMEITAAAELTFTATENELPAAAAQA